MGRTLLFVLALVAGSQAGPIQDMKTVDNCAKQCAVSNKFNYEPGTTYQFHYNNEIRTSLQGASEEHAGLDMSATVHIDVITKCELVMRLSDVRLKEHDPETATMRIVTSDFNDNLEKNPLRVSFQDGSIDDVCLTAPESPRVLNIKRGILSVFQNKMDDITKDQTVSESDVAGNCEASYSSTEKGWYNLLIKKSKNLLGCTGRHSSRSAVQGIPYGSKSDIQSLPLVKSTHDCEQDVVRATGRLNSAICRESHKFAPFSRLKSGAITHNTQTLTFVKEMKSKSTPAPVMTRATLQFDHSYNAEEQNGNKKDLEHLLMDICLTTTNGVRPETPRLFTALVENMRTMEASDLSKVYQKIKSQAICSENNKRVSKFFLDAIPMIGNSASLNIMTKLITSNEVTGIEADMWLTTLAFIQNPTVDMLTEVKPLLSMKKNEEKAMLSVSSLVHSLCRNNKECDNILEVRKIISLLESKIGTCKVKDSNFKTTVLAIRAIGNAGFGTGAISTLTKCIQQSANPIEIRLSAIEAFRRMSCKADKSRIVQIFTDSEEDSEVRIAAYKTIMECPSDDILRKVKYTLAKEEVNQVGSYVWSHLTNLMESSDPHKQAIKSILEDATLQKDFDMDKRKFSRNYEGSIFLEKLNTGATVEGDMIWSSKSFIPRSAMLNLTVDLFGSAINLFEIGGRAEGLEYFLESYFGPNGYFSENDVQAAADETAVQTIKADKTARINKRMRSGMDELRGSLYMRVFGNELRYVNFQGLDSLISQNSFNFLDMLMSLAKENDYQFTQSTMFLDSSIIIPTSSGFPLNLTVNGTSTVDMKASGKMDVMKLKNSQPTLNIHGIIRPSAAVEISSMMSIDAFVTKVGIKMISSLHTSTAVQGKVSLSQGTVLNAEFDLPEDKMEVISVKSSFFTVHRDLEREQKMITENRQEHSVCSGNKLAKITGLELCGELQYPNASLIENAPYFPLTGPVKAGVTLYKRDSLTGYKMEARSTHTKDANVIRLAFSTPNSKIDRSFGIDFNLNKVDGTFDSSFTSPWKRADFKGTVSNDANLKGLSGKLNWDNTLRYEVKATISAKKSVIGMSYTPSVTIRVPGKEPMDLSGTVKYAPWKLVDVDMSLNGITKSPIILKSTLMNKLKMLRASITVQTDKKGQYSIDSTLQKDIFKKKMIYKPQISIRTPNAEVFALGGSITHTFGSKVVIEGIVDKLFTTPIKVKTIFGKKEFRRGRTLYNVNVNLRSPVVDVLLKSKFDNRNMKTLATDIDLKYVIRRYARDDIKFLSKVTNLSTKTLSKFKTNVMLSSKKRPHVNFKVLGNFNHNSKVSAMDVDLKYGSNPKDESKQISMSTSLKRAIKSWSFASLTFNGHLKNGNDMRIVTKIDHSHTKKSLESSVSLRLNKNAVTSKLNLQNKSDKQFTNMIGVFELSYPGKTVMLSQTINETKPDEFTSDMIARIGKYKNNVQTTWKRISQTSLEITSNINLHSLEPLRIHGEYNLGPQSYKASGSVVKGTSKYIASATAQVDMDKSIQMTTDIEYPSRHIVANLEGTKTGIKYNSRADIRWNADRDDSQRVTVSGKGQVSDMSNIDGSVTVQFPSRTIAMNIKHSAGKKYVSHIDFQWERNQVIAVDTIFGDYKKLDNRQIQSTFKLKTPFRSLKSLAVTMNQEMEDKQYKSKLDIEWNPKKIISTTFTLRRPFSMSTLYADFVAKTPFAEFKNIHASVSHRLNNGFSSVGKLDWNKKSVVVDLSFETKNNEKITDIKGQIDIKTSFKSLKTATVTISHNSNGKLFKSNAMLQYNKKQYGIQSTLRHRLDGWNVNNNGEIQIVIPSDTITTKWEHSNTLKDTTTSSETTWGNNRRVFVKYSGLQDITITEGTVSSALEIQTPFNTLRDIIFQINHVYRQGQIDTNMKLTNEGSTLASAEVKYLNENGQVISSVIMSNPVYDGDVVIKLNSAYTNYPKTGHLEVSLTPLQTITIDGSYDRATNGDIDTSVTVSPNKMDTVTVQGSRRHSRKGIQSTIAVIRGSESVMRLESLHRLESEKMIQLKFTSDFTEQYTAEASLQKNERIMQARANIEAQPYIGKWSVEASLDTYEDINGRIRLNTPYSSARYSQIGITSSKTNAARQSFLMIEYLPGKIIELKSQTTLENFKNVKLSIELSTPFNQLPYAAIVLNHRGDLMEFSNHGEIEYERGSKIMVDSTFSSRDGYQGSVSIRTPFSEEMLGSFSHVSSDDTLQSHGEITWKKTLSADLKHKGTIEKFTSEIKFSNGENEVVGDVDFNLGPKMTVAMSVQTPLKRWENVKIAYSLEGTLARFTNQIEVSNSFYGKIAIDANVNTENVLSADISIQTPIKGYSNMKASVSHEGTWSRFETKVEAQNGKQKIAGDVKVNTDPAFNFEASVQTPFKGYKQTRVSLTHEGEADNFKTHIEVQQNKGVSEADLIYSYKKKLDVDLTVRSPYVDTIKISIDQWGSLKKFTSKLRVKYGIKRMSSDIGFQVKPTFNAQISIKTPFDYLKNQQLSLKHAGTSNNFKCNMQYKCNGKTYLGDASFQNLDDLTGEFNLKGPSFRPINMKIAHEGSVSNFKSSAEMSMGKKAIQVNAKLDTRNGVKGNVDVTSPFSGYESIKGGISQTGSVMNFKSHGDVSINKKQGQIDLTFDGTKDVIATVSVKSPFKGYKTITSSVKHTRTTQGFSTIATYGLNGNTLEGEISFDNSSPLTASALLKSSFPNIDDIAATFNHNGKFNKFNTRGEVTYAKSTSEITVVFDSTNGYEGNININAPLLKNTEVGFKHVTTERSLNTNAYAKYNGQTQYSFDSDLTSEPNLSAMITVNTPIEGLETTLLSGTFAKTSNNYKSNAELLFKGDRSTLDMTVVTSRDMEGRLTVKSPLMKDFETTMYYTGKPTNFKSMFEYTYGRRSQMRTEAALNTEMGISGELRMDSPYMKNIEASFNHNGELKNFSSQAQFIYAGKKSGGSVSIGLTPNVDVTISVEAPFFEKLDINLRHDGPITNCKTTGDVSYGGESKFNLNSEFVSESSIDGEIQINTVIPEYRRIVGKLSHNGEIFNFRSHGELSLENQNVVADIIFSPREGRMSFKAPMISDVKASYNIEKSGQSNAKLSYGSKIIFEATTNVNYPSNGEFILKTPLTGYESIRVGIRHSLMANGADIHAEAEVNGVKHEGDVSYKIGNTVYGAISLKSPMITSVSTRVDYTGKPTDFKSHGEFNYGNSKHEINTSFNMEKNLRGDLSIMSPLMSDLSISFDTNTDLVNLDSHSEITYGTSKMLDIKISLDSSKGKSGSVIISIPANVAKIGFTLEGDLTSFTGHAEAQLNDQKTTGEIYFSKVNNVEGSIEFKSPFTVPVSGRFIYNGQPTRFTSHAEITINSEKSEVDAALNIVGKIDGTVSIKSPMISPMSAKLNFKNMKAHAELTSGEDKHSVKASWVNGKRGLSSSLNMASTMIPTIDVTLKTNTDIRNLNTDLKLSYGDIKKLDVQVSTDLNNKVSGYVTVMTPENNARAEINMDGDITNFNTHTVATLNDQIVQADISFKMNSDIKGNMKIESPFGDLEASFTHAGKISNFRSNAEFIYNNEKSEAYVAFNTETAIEGSISISTPVTKSMKASFEYTGSLTNFRSLSSVQYGEESLLNAEASFSKLPLKGSVQIGSPIPGYETMSASFYHNGQVLDFTNHAELIISGEKTEVDLTFNAGSKLEGRISANSPYFQSTSAAFKFSGNLDKFISHVEINYNIDMYAVDATLDTKSNIDSSLTISTPIQGYKSIKATLSHNGKFPNINSMIQVKTGRRTLAMARVLLSNTNGLVSQMSLQSVLTPTIQINIGHKGQMSDFTSNADIRYNSKTSSVNVVFKSVPTFEGSLTVSTPFTDIISGNFNVNKGTNDVSAHVEGSLGSKTISGDVSFENGNAYGTTIGIKTPFKGFENMQGSAKFTKMYKGFTSYATVEMSSTQKVQIDAESSWRGGLTGSMSIQTPFEALKHSSANFKLDGVLPNVKSEFRVLHSGEKFSIEGEFEYQNSITGKLFMATPFKGYENAGMTFNSQGQLTDLQAGLRIYADDNEIVASVQNMKSEGKLDTKAKLESPYTEDVSFELSYNGNPLDFSNTVVLAVGEENTVTSKTTFRFAESSLALDASVSTIFNGYSDEQKVKVYYDALPNLKAAAYAKLFGSEYSLESTLQADSKVVGMVSLRTPFSNLKDVAFSINHSGNSKRFTTKTELQFDTDKKVEADIQYAKYGWRTIQTSLEVRTPFDGGERSRLSYRHSASLESFECDVEASLLNKDISGNLQASKSPISVTLAITTPFENYEDIGADMKLDYGTYFYNTEANMKFMQGKSLVLSSEMNLNTSPKIAFLKVSSPFVGYETSEIRLTHTGNLNNFQSVASLSTPITPTVRVQANLRSSSLSNIDGSLTFTSQIKNFENLKFVLQNEAVDSKYNTNVEASWAPYKTIALTSSLVNTRNSMNADVSLISPFESLRQFNLKSKQTFLGTKYTEIFSMQYNQETFADFEMKLNTAEKKSASLLMRSPRTVNVNIEGSNINGKYEGEASVSTDSKNLDNVDTITVLLDTNTNELSLKHSCSKMPAISFNGVFQKSNSKADLYIDNTRYGYDMSISNTDGRIKVILPSRSLQLSGSQRYRTTEGAFMWDADKDETKKVGFRSTVVPSKQSVKADVTLMMPSIGKDVKIDSEMVLNRGSVLFDGKTELTYSKDSRKKFTITSRLEDISSGWSAKNYSFSLGVSHPYTSVGVLMSSHLGHSDSKLTAAFDVEYLTVRRETKTFSVNGELNKLKNSVNFDVNTPVKKISINGNAKLESPFSVSLTNKYDNKRPLNTIATFDPIRRSVDFQMNYDLENPNSELHFNAKYVNSSAVSAELFHVVNRQRITDALLALRLNNSHLLHNRIHWRPSMINDLKEYSSKKIESYRRQTANLNELISNSVEYELTQKAKLIGNSFSEEMEPLTNVLKEKMETLSTMYELNEYHLKDISDSVMASAMEARLVLGDMSDVTKEYINIIVERLESNLNVNVDLSCLENALEYILIQNTKMSGHLYNMTQHESVQSLKQKYNDYSQYIYKLNTVPEHITNMADQYTSAIYGAHELMNGPVMQQGMNAYKYWEVRENTETVVKAIIDWIKNEIEKEVSDIQATILNLGKTAVTVYDPEHGEIQMDIHLPLPLRSLDAIPTVDVTPYVTKAKKYMPKVPSFTLPSSDVTTWLPPYDAIATIEGNKVTTFDGLTYDLGGSCTYLLARDFVNGNFSLALNKKGNTKTVHIMADGKAITIQSDGQVLVNNKPTELPTVLKNIVITSLDGHVKVEGAGSFEVDYFKDLDTYTIKLNGWYFGKTSGLLGTYDNEPSNDLMTSYGRPTSTAERFSRTWDIGTARCQ